MLTIIVVLLCFRISQHFPMLFIICILDFVYNQTLIVYETVRKPKTRRGVIIIVILLRIYVTYIRSSKPGRKKSF